MLIWRRALLPLLVAMSLQTSPALADVQNLDGDKEVEITAEGLSAEEALKNCEFAAVDDTVKQWVQTDEERGKYAHLRAVLLEGRAEYLTRLEILGKGTTDAGGRYYTIRFRLDLKRLHERLIQSGVIQAERQVSQQLNAPTIAAYYHDPLDVSTYARWSVERINHFLLEQGFHVVDAQVLQELAQDDRLVSQGQGDARRLGQILAKKANADVVIEVVTEPKLVGRSGEYSYYQCPVQIRAFAVSSGEPFITKVYQRLGADGQPEALAIKGNADVSAKAVIEESVAGAMPMVLADLMLYWKQALANGQQYRLTFEHLQPDRAPGLEAGLQPLVNQLQAVGGGQYLVRFQGELADLADTIDERLGAESGCRLDSFDLGKATFTCS